MFIERIKEKYDVNEPIFIQEILSLFQEYSKAYVFRLINKAFEEGELIKFNNGVYYIPKKTILGISTITSDDVIRKKYMQNRDDIFGIYNGLKLLNIISITTQVPNTIEIISNKEKMRCRKITLDKRNYILRKSYCPISKDNVIAYTLLQIFNDMDVKDELNNLAKQSIIRFIKSGNITLKEVLDLANYFPSKAMKRLFISGILNEIK